MKKSLVVMVILGLAAITCQPDILAQQEGGGPGYEWGEPVPPPDLGPAPFAPPLPPPEQAGPETGGLSPALELPPGLADALSIYPSSSQAPMPKAMVDLEGGGPVFEPNDVSILKEFKRKADLTGRLGWSVGDEVSGRGIEGDDSGRLTRLILEEAGLSGSLDISGAAALTEIKSTSNRFVSMNISGLPLLSQLMVNGAELGVLPKGALTRLPALSSLNLGSNRINSIEAEAFSGLAGLDILNLSDNGLRHIGKQYWAGLGRLVDLNLSGNRLETLPRSSFASLSRLTGLNLAGNRLKEVGEGVFQGLGKLETLRLDNNRLDRLSRGSFSGLESLKNINLSGNRLAAPDAALFSGLSHLADVDLRGNCLPLGSMKTLQDKVSAGTYLRLRNQSRVYFSLRVQLLGKTDSFTVPGRDAAINGLPSRFELVDGDPSGAVYTPPAKQGESGRLVFSRPGVYRFKLSNRELSEDPEVASTSGHILVVDKHPTLAEATELLGSRDLAKALIDGLSRRGFVEVPAGNAKMVSALKALFDDDEFFR